MSQAKQLRRLFYRELRALLPLVWPVFSVLIGLMVGLGLLIGHLEGWRLLEGIYFAFVTGLTVGYGDLVPKLPLSRVLAIAIGFTGILLTALLAALGVRALQTTLLEKAAPRPIPNGRHDSLSRAAAPAG